MCRMSIMDGFTSKELYDASLLLHTAKQNLVSFCQLQATTTTYSTTVKLDRMCLIHSIIKGRKIDVGSILHQEITNCAARSVKSPPIVHVSDVEKEEESRDIDECMRRIDNLVEGEIIASKEAPAIEEEVVVEEKDIYVEVVKEKDEEENIETKATEKESVEYIVNTLATVISTGPLKVIPPIQEAADDARAEPEPKEQSENRAKPKEKKRKCSKDKKCKKEEKKKRKKKYRAATLMAKEN
ncbi:hypothetical protein PVK06_027546 [Gossypium arboreum]|uniref:Uncharacterized protein n=1 Tax=Gossypium arboreum TaxID=29729 RepID=A0ABR0P0I9_GOSAR|nr:hypothetical protein PVK06_027546 [Gossypium arboreum]